MSEEAVGFPPASDLAQRIPASDSWKCVRCGTILPSPGDGRSPVACLESLGGCGRSSDDDSNHTRFFPADWGDAKVRLYIDAELDESQRLCRDVQDALRAHYYLEKPWHYVISTLFVFQAYVTASLPVVFYLPVAGPKGTGKTNFLSLIATLTGALQFENVSVAAMARAMRFGRTVTMDELDTDRGKEANEIRDSLLRSGYKRNAPAYVRWDTARKVAEEIHVFGPRAFGYRGSLEDALQDRGFPIPSVKPIGPSGYDFVLANFWPELADLPARLRTWGDGAKMKFPEERLKEIAHSDAFRQKVRSAVQVLGANRDSELVTVALLVAEMVGVDVVTALSEAGKLREVETSSASDLDAEDLKDALLEVAGPVHKQSVVNTEIAVAPTVRVKQIVVRRKFDEKRKARGVRHLGDSGFAKLRRDVVKDDWLGSHAGAVFWNVPIPVLAALSSESIESPHIGSTGSPASPDSIQGWGDPGDPGDSIVAASIASDDAPSGTIEKPAEAQAANRILGVVDGVHPCDLCGSRAAWKVAVGIWLRASCTECLPKFGLEPPGGSL